MNEPRPGAAMALAGAAEPADLVAPAGVSPVVGAPVVGAPVVGAPVVGAPVVGAPVVVAVDDSATAFGAVAWAADEAAARGCGLVVLGAVDDLGVGAGRHPGGVLEHARGVARRRQPSLVVGVRRVDDEPVAGLLDVAEDARLLVLGAASGPGPSDLVGRTSCPVVVVLASPDGPVGPDGPVVAGVDGTTADTAVLAAAFGAAAAHDLPLTVVHAGHGPRPRVPDDVDDQLAAWSVPYPSVRVTADAVQEEPATALALRSSGAALVVVGGGRHGGVGTVGRALLTASACPLLFAATPLGGRERTGPGTADAAS
ncbi:universal stress protein [Pseudonocardia benzenivorans]|uniref:Universal stress protein n=1 Tax=Pseudonocardia benzenivorans TaxID=228005 RepID=A0ABW3VKA9_9PSEU